MALSLQSTQILSRLLFSFLLLKHPPLHPTPLYLFGSDPPLNHNPVVRNPASSWLHHPCHLLCVSWFPTVFAVERGPRCILLPFDFQRKLKRSLYRDADTQLSIRPRHTYSSGLLSVRRNIQMYYLLLFFFFLDVMSHWKVWISSVSPVFRLASF